MFDHVLQQLAHGLEQQHRDLVLERLWVAVVFHGHQQALLLSNAIGQPAQRFEQAAFVQSRRRQLQHQRARLQGGVGEHLLHFVDALNRFRDRRSPA